MLIARKSETAAVIRYEQLVGTIDIMNPITYKISNTNQPANVTESQHIVLYMTGQFGSSKWCTNVNVF